MLDFFGVCLDKALARLRVISHQPVEYQADGSLVFQHNPQELTTRRIHGRFPKLIGVHFAKALVPLNYNVGSIKLLENAVAFGVVPCVVNITIAGDAIERGLRNIEPLIS